MKVKDIKYSTSDKRTSIKCKIKEVGIRHWFETQILIWKDGSLDGIVTTKHKEYLISTDKTKEILNKTCDKNPELNDIVAKDLI